jgi:hypothetical protein
VGVKPAYLLTYKYKNGAEVEAPMDLNQLQLPTGHQIDPADLTKLSEHLKTPGTSAELQKLPYGYGIKFTHSLLFDQKDKDRESAANELESTMEKQKDDQPEQQYHKYQKVQEMQRDAKKNVSVDEDEKKPVHKYDQLLQEFSSIDDMVKYRAQKS